MFMDIKNLDELCANDTQKAAIINLEALYSNAFHNTQFPSKENQRMIDILEHIIKVSDHRSSKFWDEFFYELKN